MLGQWQRSYSFAGGRKYGVAHRRQNRRQWGLAKSRGGVCRPEETYLDLARRLGHPHWQEFIQVALHRPSSVYRDLVAHELAQSIDDCALNLVDGVGRINDLTPDITGRPDLVDPYFVGPIDTDLRNFGEISEMAEVASDAHGRTLSQFS